MDRRIIFVTATVVLCCTAFLLYRKLYYKHEGVKYVISPKDLLHVSDSLLFRDLTPDANRWLWDFGDGEYSIQQTGRHAYLAPGRYNVKLSAYGSFGMRRDSATFIDVLASERVVETVAPVTGPDMLTSAQPGTFECNAAAESYEWKVEGDPALATGSQRGKQATYTFRTAGTKTLVVTTANPKETYRKQVVVRDAAVAPQTPPPVITAEPRRTQAPAQKRPDAPKPKKESSDDMDGGVEYTPE